MGLGGGTINDWDQMKTTFLKKYQDFCRTRELKDEIFQMVAKTNETLEEYVEHFQYNLQRSPYANLSLEVLKTTMIKGMKDQWVEKLNLMGKGDIYQEDYENILQLCIRCSRGSTRLKPTWRDTITRDKKALEGSITRVEIGNLLEDFKIDILGTLMTQLDIMQSKENQVEVEQNLAIFYPHCKNKHSHRECLLDMIQTCAISTKDHATEGCPSLPD